ncbi:hypothetical protein M9458_026646, partial [Cirrhinus mrigala]
AHNLNATVRSAPLYFQGRHAKDCHELSCPVTRWRWDLTGILIRSASSVSTGERDRRKNTLRATSVFVR